MNILIYAPYINSSCGGIYHYFISLIKILSKDNVNNYYIYNFSSDELVNDIIKSSKNLYKISNKKYLETNLDYKITRILELINNNIKFKIKIKTKLDKICKIYNIDIVHCPYQYLPNTSLKKIITMHDVQELHFPEFFTSAERAYRAVNYKKAIDNAQKIIVSYDHVKNDLIKFFEKKEDDIKVILLDMKNLWFEKFLNSKFQKINKYGEFILYPAVTWKHKNHKNLLIAFKKLLSKNKNLNLVCTGRKTDYFYNELQYLIIDLNIQNNVYFEDVVDEEYLYALYKSCKAVVIPTFYEAGSFPLIESILLNIPVVCSNVTSLPSTIENDKFIFDPYNIDDIYEKMCLILFDKSYIQENIENSQKVSKHIIDNGALDKIISLYNDIKELS